ncbi:hypothetical protein LCGC14_1014940 [marine sediment metagenome]|uniref:Uncharacterized protein n=1 Tax=marine sediment metagenome TaxID=412755 RepID=A0A0F9NKP0_9ZZZZ
MKAEKNNNKQINLVLKLGKRGQKTKGEVKTLL